MRQQLGLATTCPVVRRVWVTPGGRLAAHVALPAPLAARVLARKRHRLRGTAYSVDLVRDQLEWALWKVGREEQQRQQQLVDMPAAGCQQVETPDLVAPAVDGMPLWQWPALFASAACLSIILYMIFTMHFFPP